MILADKIIESRKKNGWSQEELAEKLNVSRQSVSKWESAQAIPDMKRILQLAEVFGVTTDYLLKDECEEAVVVEDSPSDSFGSDEAIRKVSIEDANAFLEFNDKAASRISTGVMLCIMSPIILIVLPVLSGTGRISLGEYAATASGIVILLLMVAVAVALFIFTSMKGSPFEYLEKQGIDTEYGVSGMVKERMEKYKDAHTWLLVIGIGLCIICAVPVIAINLTGYTSGDGFLVACAAGGLLLMVAIGVKMIVLTAIKQGGFQKLLEEGDYTRLNKKAGKYAEIYWAIALVVYLGWSFVTMRWHMTWIVWPIAGVLYIVYNEIVKLIIKSKSE